MKNQIKQAKRLDVFKVSDNVWTEFTPMAIKYNAINLGQGFPDWPAQNFVKQNIIKSVEQNFNQYCRSAGHINLVKEIANKYSKILNRNLNPETEITIGVGASETLFCVMNTFINPLDEVILITPSFDIYTGQVELAGGICKYVPLKHLDNSWKIDMNELRQAFSDKTKAIIINSPQNPTGKIFSYDELKQISQILEDFPNVIAICDDVYEYIQFTGKPIPRLANLPNMWDRTITVSSSGKTFSVTGWKVGWAIGPDYLIKPMTISQAYIQFSVSTPAQQAIAQCLQEAEQPFESHENYYAWLAQEYERKKNILMKGLLDIGINPIEPDGSFFLMVDTSKVNFPQEYMNEKSNASPVMTRDWAFARFLAREIGVVGIPPSAFYDEKDKHLSKNFIRLAFCKEDQSLHEAVKRLQKLKEYF